MKWTDAQQAAIDAPKPGSLASQTLLVAAAAGSGKTAVLVERIIQRLKSKDNPLSIQELMVVTFTKAAAAETWKNSSACCHPLIFRRSIPSVSGLSAVIFIVSTSIRPIASVMKGN